MWVGLCLKGLVSLCPSLPNALPILPPLLRGSLSPEGELWLSHPISAWVFQSSSFSATFSVCRPLYLFPTIAWGSFYGGDWTRIFYEDSRTSLGVIWWLHSFNRMVAFGFPVGPWPICSQVLCYPRSARYELHLIEVVMKGINFILYFILFLSYRSLMYIWWLLFGFLWNSWVFKHVSLFLSGFLFLWLFVVLVFFSFLFCCCCCSILVCILLYF